MANSNHTYQTELNETEMAAVGLEGINVWKRTYGGDHRRANGASVRTEVRVCFMCGAVQKAWNSQSTQADHCFTCGGLTPAEQKQRKQRLEGLSLKERYHAMKAMPLRDTAIPPTNYEGACGLVAKRFR